MNIFPILSLIIFMILFFNVACDSYSSVKRGNSTQSSNSNITSKEQKYIQIQIEKTLNGFISTHVKRTWSGIPDEFHLNLYRPYLSNKLYKLLLNAKKAEDDHLKLHGLTGGPIELDGDIFSSLFEGPTSYAIKKNNWETNKVICLIVFTLKEENSEKSFTWEDEYIFIKESDKWAIDDVNYRGNWGLANRGLLSKSLQEHTEKITSIINNR